MRRSCALEGEPMKRLALTLMTGLLVGVVLVPSVAAARPSPFTGAWTSVDLDGSDQTLAVSGGSVVRLQYTRFGVPLTCEGGQGEMFVGTLTGTVSEDTLSSAIVTAHCGSKMFPIWRDWSSTSFTTEPATRCSGWMSSGIAVRSPRCGRSNCVRRQPGVTR